MGYAVFKANSAGFKAMAVSDEVRACLMAKAEAAKVEAIALSAPFRVTGEYERSFEVVTDTTMLKTAFGTHPVATAILGNTAPYAPDVEWGNKDDRKPHRVLGKVLATLETL
jgi:hypothetical protein